MRSSLAAFDVLSSLGFCALSTCQTAFRFLGFWRTQGVPCRAIVCFDEQTAVLVVMGQEDQLTCGSRRRALHLALKAAAKGEEDKLTCGRRRRALSLAFKAGRDVVVYLRGLRFADSSLLGGVAVLAHS